MGLAASHARLCMLTRRKASNEGRLMRVSNAKMALARDSEKVSREYTRALNATSLVYNTGAKDVPLTYGLIMSPSTQCMLTNSAGKVVLNNELWDAIGSPANGQPTRSAAQFISTMTKTDFTDADVAKIASSTPPPSTGSAKSASISTSYSDLAILSYLKDPANGAAPFKDKLGQGDVYFGGTAFCFYQCEKKEVADKSSLLNKSGLYGIIEQITTATTAAVESKVGKSKDISSAAADAATATWNFFQNQMLNYKADNTDSTPDGGGGFWSNAWDTAKGSVSSALKNGSGLSIADGSLFTDAKNGWGGTLTGGINIIGENTYNYATYADPSVWNANTINKTAGTVSIYNNTDDKQEFYIDPNQVALVFLRFFDAACGDTDITQLNPASSNQILNLQPNSNGDLCVGARAKAGTNPTGATDPTTPTSGTTSTSPSPSAAAAQYYYNLYQAICDRGAAKDTDVDNKDYMQGMIQYGSYGVKKYQNGTWVELSQNSPDSPISATTNEERRAKAKAEYDAKKDAIKTKEVEWDVEQTATDTERAAVVADIDSVKKILDKNMDSFKLFQQG